MGAAIEMISKSIPEEMKCLQMKMPKIPAADWSDIMSRHQSNSTCAQEENEEGEEEKRTSETKHLEPARKWMRENFGSDSMRILRMEGPVINISAMQQQKASPSTIFEDKWKIENGKKRNYTAPERITHVKCGALDLVRRRLAIITNGCVMYGLFHRYKKK